MVKSKFISLLSAVVIIFLLQLCVSGCNKSADSANSYITTASSETTAETTADEANASDSESASSEYASNSMYDIDFTAEFNSETNTVDVSITNNTGMDIYYSADYELYKKTDDGWVLVDGLTYAQGGTEYLLSPYFGSNSEEVSYYAYPAEDENGGSISGAESERYLGSGEYKIVVPAAVYEPIESEVLSEEYEEDGYEYGSAESEDSTEAVETERIDIELEAYFSVE